MFNAADFGGLACCMWYLEVSVWVILVVGFGFEYGFGLGGLRHRFLPFGGWVWDRLDAGFLWV